MQPLRVIFRAEKSGDFKGAVTAIFPDDPTVAGWLSAYSHVGQHSMACPAWYRTTRPATLDEYAPLLAELRLTYETGPDAMRLVVCKRR